MEFAFLTGRDIRRKLIFTMHIVSDDDSSNGKNKEGNRKSVEGYTRVVREDLNEKTACEQRSEESEGGSHVII